MWIRDAHDIADKSDWVVMHIRIHNDLEEYLFWSILLFFYTEYLDPKNQQYF